MDLDDVDDTIRRARDLAAFLRLVTECAAVAAPRMPEPPSPEAWAGMADVVARLERLLALATRRR